MLQRETGVAADYAQRLKAEGNINRFFTEGKCMLLSLPLFPFSLFFI